MNYHDQVACAGERVLRVLSSSHGEDDCMPRGEVGDAGAQEALTLVHIVGA